MVNTIKIKNSNTASAIPSTLEYGELAINYTDGKLFYKNSLDQIVSFSSGSTGIAGTTYNATIGNGSANAFTITHNLGTRDVVVVIKNAAAPYENIEARWEATNTNNISIDFSWVPTINSIRVSIYAAVTGTQAIGLLDELGDVVITSLSSGQFLKWDGANWVNAAVPQINALDDVGDVALLSPVQNQVLAYNGSNWINSNVNALSGTSYTQSIGDGSLSSITITHNLGTRDVYVLFRQADSPYDIQNVYWEATTLNTITAVFDSPPSTNSIRAMVYAGFSTAQGTVYSANVGNGSDTQITLTHNLGTRDIFISSRLVASPYSDVPISWQALTTNTAKIIFASAPTLNEVRINIFSSSSASQVAQSVSSLTDATISSASAGQVLKWDGSKWINSDTVSNLIVTGDLTVSGTTTTINTTELNIEDNLIVLNTGSSATPSYNAGIEIERGNFTNVQIRWNESSDKWQFTNDGTIYKDLGSGGVTVSDTIPSSPASGDMWYESDTGSLFAFYDLQWIEIGGSAAYDNIIGQIQAKGDILTGTASQALGRTAVGADSTRLVADSLQTTGLSWVSDTQNTVINAKGDLLVGTADNTVARQAIGSSGQVLTANPLFSSGVTWATPTTYKNYLMNGMFTIDQRGKAASHTVTAGAALSYTVDRWYEYCTGGDVTAARSVYLPTLGAPYSPYYTYTFTGSASNTLVGFGQRIESINAVSLSGGFATISALIYSSTSKVITWTAYYANTSDTFGTLASPTRTQIATGTYTTTTSPGTSSFSSYFPVTANQANGIEIVFTCPSLTTGQTLSFANIQLERGVTQSECEQRSIGAELNLCQRYYWRSYSTNIYTPYGVGATYSTSAAQFFVFHPIPMRTTVYSIDSSSVGIGQVGLNEFTATISITGNASGPNVTSILASGTGYPAAGTFMQLIAKASSSSYLGFNAEL